MTRLAGVLRSQESLTAALDIARRQTTDHELRNLGTVAQALITAALVREESRGAHTRTDFPDTLDMWRIRSVLTSAA